LEEPIQHLTVAQKHLTPRFPDEFESRIGVEFCLRKTFSWTARGFQSKIPMQLNHFKKLNTKELDGEIPIMPQHWAAALWVDHLLVYY
jgi:hypothetical protein